MSTPTTITDIHSLTVTQRIELIGKIWDILIADGWRLPLSGEMKAELCRRVEAVESGDAKLIDWEDVKRAGRAQQ